MLNKPAGITSFDAVRKCRRIFQEKKAGHTGTLDPQASGLMIILLGKYTKLLPFCVKDHKAYHATFQLGIATDTEDIWGNVVEEKKPQMHSQSELDALTQSMLGDQMQIPPMYAAIKKDGRKLYEYARQGITVEREPRPIHIDSLTVQNIGDNTYEMDAVVSSGTYIRTLITDFAKGLGEIGTMTSLVRTAIENVSLDMACNIDALEELHEFVDPLKVLSSEYHLVDITEDKRIMNGMKIKQNYGYDKIIFCKEGKPLAAYERRDDGLYHCLRGFF
ncbi:MAG: tRNA pseudouridine(55) synthase TruB [Solobacterium sp.]|nr:tRNA pseudouridine(55) synthase TruB [Solobacterium sp.]